MASDTRKGDIELVSVTKRFGDMVAVDNVSLRIPHGAYCCLLGPSGCGKTTILRMIAGHETPSQGDIRIGGASVAGQTPLQRGTAMMFQAYALFPHLSVLDNVAFSLKMRGLDREARHSRPANCWPRSGSINSPTACRRNCPAVSSSAWRWRAP